MSSKWGSAAIQEFEQVTLENGTELFRVRARIQVGDEPGLSDDPGPRPVLVTNRRGELRTYEPLSSGGDRRGLLRLAYRVPSDVVQSSTTFALQLPDGQRIDLPAPTPGLRRSEAGLELDAQDPAPPASRPDSAPSSEPSDAESEPARELERTRQRLQVVIGEHAAANEELESIRTANDAARDELRTTRDALAATQADLEAALNWVQTAEAEREEARRHARAAVAARDDAHRTVESANGERDEARQHAASLAAQGNEAVERAERAREQREAVHREVETAQSERDAARAHAAGVEAERDEALRGAGSAQAERDAARREVESVRVQLEAARQELETARAEHETALGAAAAARGERDAALASVATAADAARAARADRDATLEATAQSRAEHARLTTRLRQHEARVELLRADVQRSQATFTPAGAGRLRQLEVEREQLTEHVRALADLLSANRREVGSDRRSAANLSTREQISAVRERAVKAAYEQAERDLEQLAPDASR